MSSKAITEKRDEAPQARRWETPTELAPSSVQDSAPLVSRWIGAIGLALFVLGGMSLGLYLYGKSNPLIPPLLSVPLAFVGLGGLLFHAANDAELQVRRIYLGVAVLWLALGVILSLVPYKLAGMDTTAVGALFLPYGLLCLALGLAFMMAFVRNETEAQFHDLAVYAVGGLGVAIAVTGLLGGTISHPFLVPYGVVLIALGLVFLWAFVVMRGTADDWGYLACYAIGGLGLAFFLVALGRSYLPQLLERIGWLTPGTPQYIMPDGLLVMAGGIAYLLLGIAFVSDRQIVVLTRRELGALFFSPVAYFVLLGYIVLGGWIFLQFAFNLWPPTVVPSPPPEMPEPIVQYFIIDWPPIMSVLMLVPVLTMRLFSEEHRTGTLEMMFTAPVGETVVVVAKFLAAMLLFLAVWAPWGLYLVALRWYGGTEFDYRPLIGFGIALLFSGAAFISLGLFYSSVTRNQLAAAVFTFVSMFALFAIYFIPRFLSKGSSLSPILMHLAFVNLWIQSLRGRLAPRDLMIYLSAAIFFLFVTVKVLDSRKWR